MKTRRAQLLLLYFPAADSRLTGVQDIPFFDRHLEQLPELRWRGKRMRFRPATT